VIVRPFDPRFWPDNRLEYDFLQTIGAPRDGIAPLAKPVNESLDFRSVELVRRLNGILPELSPNFDEAKRKKTRMTLLRQLRQIEAEVDERKKMALSSSQSEEMRQFFADDNAASLAGSGISHEDFFPPADTEKPARIAPERLPEAFATSLIARLALAQTRS